VTEDLISKKTRTVFRDFLVNWNLREIASAFEAAGVQCDQNYNSAVQGQRRSLVEQHYRTLDFSKPDHARRFVAAVESVLVEAERRSKSAVEKSIQQDDIDRVLTCLVGDGLRYEKGKIRPTTKAARRIFEMPEALRTISEVTRRNIMDEISMSVWSWSGRLDDYDFLSRLYDLKSLPSTDGRFKSFGGDISQHRISNRDWPDDWVFTDSRVDLLHAPDDEFLRFLCEMVHPAVRPSQDEADRLVSMFNGHLAADHWEVAPSGQLSGRPVFSGRRQAAAQVHLEAATKPVDVLSDDYVRELAQKCDRRLAARDFDGAITTGRTLLEAILVALEKRITGAQGDYKGDLPKQFKKVAKLLRMDDERPDLDDRFKDVVRGLVMVVGGLAPLRNKMSDGHARERKPAPHHAHVVVNAAKTVAAFLVESYDFQREKGLLGSDTKAASSIPGGSGVAGP
jgi:hypothetical protein